MELRWEEVHPGLEHGGRLVDLDVAGVGGSRGAGGLAGGLKMPLSLSVLVLVLIRLNPCPSSFLSVLVSPVSVGSFASICRPRAQMTLKGLGPKVPLEPSSMGQGPPGSHAP